MPIDGKLLEILCCPVSRTPLVQLPSGQLEKLNAAIGRGEVKYVDGSPVSEPLQEGLVTEDRKVIYPVEGDDDQAGRNSNLRPDARHLAGRRSGASAGTR